MRLRRCFPVFNQLPEQLFPRDDQRSIVGRERTQGLGSCPGNPEISLTVVTDFLYGAQVLILRERFPVLRLRRSQNPARVERKHENPASLRWFGSLPKQNELLHILGQHG